MQLERALCAEPTPEELASRDFQQLPVSPKLLPCCECPVCRSCYCMASLTAAAFETPGNHQVACALQGVGDAVAAALATTTALGTLKHASRTALAAWAQAEPGNREQLRRWLLYR